MSLQTSETFYPATRVEWRKWLKENHNKKQSVWLIFYKLKSGKPRISWSDAVDEALCFGWIDSKAKPLDGERYMQFFSVRKAKSTWSKVNKEKIEKLIAGKKVAKAGLRSIEIAKQNGSWTVLDEVEAFVIPKDLAAAFRKHPGSKKYFMSLSKSVKKMILQWITLAKLPETRERRVKETAGLAAKKMKPKQF